MKCALNVMSGRESERGFTLEPVRRSERVMVIGGGPAGMQAAADAARRGHMVSLWDERRELGADSDWRPCPRTRNVMRKL